MGLDRGQSDRRLRPPPLRHLAASATRSHDAPPPELGREAMLGRLGTSRRLMGRGLAPLRRSRPLGLLLRLLHHYGRPDPARRQRRERCPAFHHPGPLRRRPPRLPRRSYSRRQCEEPPLPGRLLPAPQRPPEQEVLPPEPRRVETSHPRRAPPGPPRRRAQGTPRLVPHPRGPLLRYPPRYPEVRRPARHRYFRDGGA